MYETYLKALKALRMYLSDPEKAQEPNTMCAVYLMVICQVSNSFYLLERYRKVIHHYPGLDWEERRPPLESRRAHGVPAQPGSIQALEGELRHRNARHNVRSGGT